MSDRSRPAPPPYIRDTVFPGGYIDYLQPALLSLVAAAQGYRPPDPATPFRYLELGCGTGGTLNGLAAANPDASFVGVDFNPVHIEIAHGIASAAGLDNVAYIEATFEDFAANPQPAFDYIAINGTYSWVGPDAVAALHRIAAGMLNAGGLLFVDTLSLPGKAPIAPLWYFLRRATETHDGDGESRVVAGMRLLSRLKQANSAFLTQNPPAMEVLDEFLSRLNDDRTRRQLAHHALAAQWVPEYFPDVRDRFAIDGLNFVGSARMAKNDLDLAVPTTVRDLIDTLDDPGLGEIVKDICLDEQQRKDVFIKDAAPDPAAATAYCNDRVHFVVTGSPGDLQRNLAALSLPPDHAIPTEAKRLFAAGPGSGFGLGEVTRTRDPSESAAPAIPKSLIWLLDSRLVAPAKAPPVAVADGVDPAVVAGSFNINALAAAVESGEAAMLAAPVLGGCLPVLPLHAAVLKVRVAGDGSRSNVKAGLRALPIPFTIDGARRSVADLIDNEIDDIVSQVETEVVPVLIAVGAINRQVGRG